MKEAPDLLTYQALSGSYSKPQTSQEVQIYKRLRMLSCKTEDIRLASKVRNKTLHHCQGCFYASQGENKEER